MFEKIKTFENTTRLGRYWISNEFMPNTCMPQNIPRTCTEIALTCEELNLNSLFELFLILRNDFF